MKAYVLKYRIFDTASDPNLEVFPREESRMVYAETMDDAQREVVDELWEFGKGLLAVYSHDDDAADRFRIVFDDEPFMERPVVWNDEYKVYFWDDEPLDLQINAWKEYLATCK